MRGVDEHDNPYWKTKPNPYGGRVLQLGCGAAPMEDATNHDRALFAPWVDIAWDLDVMPWGIDGEWDVVCAFDLWEHLVDPYGAVNEAHRLLVPGGLLVFRMSAWDNPASFNDLTHKHRAAGEAFDYFDRRTPKAIAYSEFHPVDTLGRLPTEWHIERAFRTNADPRFGVGDIQWEMRRL